MFIPFSKVESSALTFEDFTYEVISESKKTAQIIDYSGKASELVIPSTIEGYSIVSIGEEAFYFNKSLVTVTVSEGVTSIDNHAFCYCENLEIINLPKSLIVVEDWAFSYNHKLSKIHFYENVRSIGNCVFFDCPNLKEIGVSQNNNYFVSENDVLFNKSKTTLICYPAGKTEPKYSIPESVVSVEQAVFAFCKSIQEVVISNNIKEISLWMFRECSSLECVTIPSSVTSIDIGAFDCCKSLTDIYYGGSESDWNRVYIYNSNDYLSVANIHFAKEADFEITTDETITLKYEANRNFDFVVSDTTIAKVGNVSTSSISWGSTVNVVSSAEIIPLKPGLVKVNVVDKSGNTLTTSTLLIKEGNHKMKLDKTIKEATCTANGEELYICEFCDYEEIKTTTKDHTFGEWEVTKQPTISEEGMETRFCSCGKVETRKIDKLSVIKGDVNNDGKITAVDARMVLQVVAGLKAYDGEFSVADVNGDGKITAVDARMILQIVAGLL